MSEVTSVSNLIKSVIGIAIALAAAGTLYDATMAAKQDAVKAIKQDQMSYGNWNRALYHPKVKLERHATDNGR